MSTDQSDRYLAASVAANTRWAHEPDRSAATRPARAAFERRFLDEVDPGRVLAPCRPSAQGSQRQEGVLPQFGTQECTVAQSSRVIRVHHDERRPMGAPLETPTKKSVSHLTALGAMARPVGGWFG